MIRSGQLGAVNVGNGGGSEVVGDRRVVYVDACPILSPLRSWLSDNISGCIGE